MTAPDRIWLDPASKEPEFYGDDISTGTDGYYVSTGDGIPDSEEYIRKGAFPVEEVERIRALLITAIGLGDATRTAGLHQGRAAQSVEALGRILSLLEGDSAEN